VLYAAAPAWVNGLVAGALPLQTVLHKQALTKNKALHTFQRAVQHHTAFLALGYRKVTKH
jgi:hypothetical protein